jgi:hypothetical protein
MAIGCKSSVKRCGKASRQEIIATAQIPPTNSPFTLPSKHVPTASPTAHAISIHGPGSPIDPTFRVKRKSLYAHEAFAAASIGAARPVAASARVGGYAAQTARANPGSTCLECGGELRLVGEDVSEILEMITVRLKVIEIARPKKLHCCYERMVQVSAPS